MNYYPKALVSLQPKRIAISGGYYGCHETIHVYQRTRGGDVPMIDINDEFQPGDLCWLETPLNPTGEARHVYPRFRSIGDHTNVRSRDIKYYADKVRANGSIYGQESRNLNGWTNEPCRCTRPVDGS